MRLSLTSNVFKPSLHPICSTYHINFDFINTLLVVYRIMADADNRIKLPPGSVIEITRLPGYVLQTKGKN